MLKQRRAPKWRKMDKPTLASIHRKLMKENRRMPKMKIREMPVHPFPSHAVEVPDMGYKSPIGNGDERRAEALRRYAEVIHKYPNRELWARAPTVLSLFGISVADYLVEGRPCPEWAEGLTFQRFRKMRNRKTFAGLYCKLDNVLYNGIKRDHAYGNSMRDVMERHPKKRRQRREELPEDQRRDGVNMNPVFAEHVTEDSPTPEDPAEDRAARVAEARKKLKRRLNGIELRLDGHDGSILNINTYVRGLEDRIEALERRKRAPKAAATGVAGFLARLDEAVRRAENGFLNVCKEKPGVIFGTVVVLVSSFALLLLLTMATLLAV